MTEAQIQLQNALTTTFLANLAFLSDYDNELYHRVDELSRMIENGIYKEKYALEFLMENGDFDIYDILNDKYLYNKNPKKFNNELIRKSEQYEKNYILDLPEYYAHKFRNVSKINREKRFDFEITNQFNNLIIDDVNEYIEATGDLLDNKKKRLKKVKKFIFIGTLLGRHIPRIAEKIDANIYLVLERNLEIFRLSLFTVDYTVLAKKSVIFSIMDSVLETEKKINQFLNISYLENYLIKFSTTSINIQEYVDNVLNGLHLLSPSAYTYNRRLYVHTNRATKYIEDKYKILLFNKTKENFDFFNNLPILYLAAGPSLDENIEWIKKNQNKFFIVTIGSAYSKLINNEIKIDLISTVDESIIFDTTQFSDNNISMISDKTVILASIITNPKILKKFNQENLFLFEVFNSIHKNNISFDGFSVGEITLDILLHLNAKEIYLIGLDLALNQKTGDSHFKDAISKTTKLDLNEKQNRDFYDTQKSLIEVKGNSQDTVFTTPLFYSSIKNLEQKIKRNNKLTKIYNLSTNGAYFDGSFFKKIEEVDINQMKEIGNYRDKFFNDLNKYSSTFLSTDSKKDLKQEVEFIESDIRKIINNIKEKDYKTFDDLFEDMHLIISSVLEKNYNALYQILVNYFQIFAPYLFYHFNDMKLKYEYKKVKKIKEIFIKQIEFMLKDYVECLKRVI
ncbi:motility associated factor glycosyltransferase family protein [Aliarcobacter cryaerophilus]|uniref:motility associated factor glycosyltransferase family protein n=1 Tax=Aliarcobacter cryaerophilus TaxID=28198 RepID=UPI003DA22F1F